MTRPELVDSEEGYFGVTEGGIVEITAALVEPLTEPESTIITATYEIETIGQHAICGGRVDMVITQQSGERLCLKCGDRGLRVILESEFSARYEAKLRLVK
jgi:hypothetical protein